MALTASDQILASDFVALKARVKAEMNRRCRQDSLVAYAGAEYDYTVVPAAGGQALIEHINKIVAPINAISDTGISSAQVAGAQLKALDNLDTALAAHEVMPMKGSGTDCAGGCAGLCSSGCWDSCTNCTGGCTGTCSAKCASGCSGSCSGGCDSTCSGGCSGCGSGCANSCSSCSSGCASGCSGGCSSSCTGSCSTGCTGSCSKTCTHGCTN